MLISLICVGITIFVAYFLSAKCEKENISQGQSFLLGAIAGLGLTVLFAIYDLTGRHFSGMGFDDISWVKLFGYGGFLSVLIGIKCAFPYVK